MSKPRYLVLCAFWSIALLAAAGAGWHLLIAERSDWHLLGLTTDDVESFARAWGAWSALASIFLMILHSFVPLPAEVIAIANGMMFGPFWGIVITWIGAMLGATLAFALARRLGRPIGRRLVSEPRWRTVEDWKAQPPTLLMVRLIPVISFNLVNYAAGVIGIRWRDFLWTTGLGILPITIASVVLGDRLLELSWPAWLLFAAGIVALWLVLRALRLRCPGLSVLSRVNQGSRTRHDVAPDGLVVQTVSGSPGLRSPGRAEPPNTQPRTSKFHLREDPMSNSSKLQAGTPMPAVALPKVGGGEIKIGGAPHWQMLVVYRGKHCPLCRKYLKTLNGLLDEFRAIDTEVIAISGDPKDKAESETAEEGWRFPVGYDLKPAQMHTLGLYISEPRSPQETDRPFPEPGLFVVNPDGKAHIIDVSNAPFSRPDLSGILNGLKFIREKNYPIRGTAT